MTLGPVRAASQFRGPAEGDSDPLEETKQNKNATNVVPPGFALDLPLPLQIIDAEQRGILRAIGASTAPAHVAHALAGCGM